VTRGATAASPALRVPPYRARRQAASTAQSRFGGPALKATAYQSMFSGSPPVGRPSFAQAAPARNTSSPVVKPEQKAVYAAPLLKPIAPPSKPAEVQPSESTTTSSESSSPAWLLSQRAPSLQAASSAVKPPVAAPPTAGSLAASSPVAEPPTVIPLGERMPATDRPITVQVAAGDSRLGPFEVIDHEDELTVVLRRSKLLRTKVDIYRTAVVDPGVCDVVQFTPREVSVIGKGEGATHVTFWFADGTHRPITYLVRVTPDPDLRQRREDRYQTLEEVLAELFPESKVELIVAADKLIVRGQARDVEEAAQIMAVIRTQGTGGGFLQGGQAADPLPDEQEAAPLAPSYVINLLQVPGVHQVALRVKIAELNRSAARSFGVDIDAAFDVGSGQILIQSLLNRAAGNSSSILGKFDSETINFGIHYLEQHGVIRMLSEPTLVTLSGRPATFVAGGEFAVPTTVGVGGVGAVTTDFRAFGAIITFLPTVIDKDHVRLEVAPEFSQIDSELSTDAGFGLSTRAVTTTVEMREGQTLAIAGLLDDSMKADTQGDLPFLAKILGAREVSRNETELIILVTPELVHPVEPEAVPPLPGFDVTEPTNKEFFLHGHIEGRPTHEYRSTVWPRLQRRYKAGGPAMISGPFGHGD